MAKVILTFLLATFVQWCNCLDAQGGTIYLANLDNDRNPGEGAVRYINKYLNTGARTVLPNHTVIVQNFGFEAGDTGKQASEALIEALRPGNVTYAGITGPRLPLEVMETIHLTKSFSILQVHISDNAELSDREIYPYNFRAQRSEDGILRVLFYIIASCGWTQVITTWATPGQCFIAAELAREANITDYGHIITSGWTFGSLAMQGIEELLHQHLVRNVIIYTNEVHRVYDLMCFLTTAGFSQLQTFLSPAISSGFWRQPPPDSTGQCEAADMAKIVHGYIAVGHPTTSPGVAIQGGVFTAPAIPDNQSEAFLPCTPDVTAQQFFNDPELWEAVAPGMEGNMPEIMRAMMQVGLTYDTICASIVGLHLAVYEDGLRLEELLRRKVGAFKIAANAMLRVAFQSVTGSFDFLPGTGDPRHIYYLADQLLDVSQPSLFQTSIVIHPGDPPRVILTKDKSFVWRDGSTGISLKPELDTLPNCSAQNALQTNDGCQECQPGYFYDAPTRLCRLCAPGTVQPQSGKNKCYVVQAGYYVLDTMDPVMALPCPTGSECPQAAMVEPTECAPGRFADTEGLSACKLCGIGKFQNEAGNTTCFDCTDFVAGSTTKYNQSVDPSDCICPEDHYLPHDESACVPCPPRMTCPMGSSVKSLLQVSNGLEVAGPYPLVEKGFMSLAKEPLRLYRCLEGAGCPGGDPGTCPTHHNPTSIACGRCELNAFERSGSCRPCGESWALFTCAVLSSLLFIAAITLAVNRDMFSTPEASLTMVTMVGLMLTSIQAVGVLSQMPVVWREPLRSLTDFAKLMSLDLNLIELPCITGTGHHEGFAFRVFAPLLLIPFVYVTLLVKKLCPKFGNPNTRVFVEVTNSAGAVFSGLFISIMLSSVAPWICYRHPGHDDLSVLKAPSILCFTGNDYFALMSIGVAALLTVPVPFLCLCIFGVYQYPSAMVWRDNVAFVHATRFLFTRLTPKRYFFQLIILFRGVCLCLVPVIFRRGATQIIVIAGIKCLYTATQQELRPWQASSCNLLDGCLNLLLLLMLVCIAMFLDEVVDIHFASAVAAAALLSLFSLLFLGLLNGARRKWMPNYFDFFICHHKAHAAAQARLLKILMQKDRERKLKVFIDSDNLQELDTLFDIVKAQLRHLVVYLTSETLRRPWCAGEITTAVKQQVQITPVQTQSFEPPSHEQLEDLENFLDLSGCNLIEYHIAIADVAMAVRSLLEMPSVALDTELAGQRRFDSVVASVLQSSRSVQRERQTAVPSSGTLSTRLCTETVLISGFPSSDEGIASGVILVLRISKEVFRLTDRALHFTPDFPDELETTLVLAHKAQAIVVMLCPGTMSCAEQVLVMMEATRRQDYEPFPGVVSVATPGFEFPDQRFYDKVLPALLQEASGSCALARVDQQTAEDLVRRFFRVISVFLPTHGSQSAIDTASRSILTRIKGSFAVVGGKLQGHSSSSTANGMPAASTALPPSSETAVKDRTIESVEEGIITWQTLRV